jgi:adenylate kinase
MVKEIEIKPVADTIIILGAPGSGKDTQAQFLVEALGFQIISSGELIRLRAAHDDELRNLLEKGELVSDDVIDDEIISVFALLSEEQPVILDGYPRTLEQAGKLDRILVENNRKVDKVLYLTVPDEDLIKRIQKRRVCAKCGKFTSDDYKSCPDCGGKLELRADDTPEAVRNRLDIFHKATEPVISYYRERNLLHEVDGRSSVEKVREGVQKLF